MAGGPERTKKPTRDYSALSRTPWTLWDVLYARRSVRKYEPAEADERFVPSFREFIDFACEASGAEPGSLRLVSDPGQVGELRERSVKGAFNKINRWLASAPLLGFLALSCPREELGADRPLRLARAALAAEYAVLWLTERGMGSCWLGAVNREEAGACLGLPRDRVVPLMICVGRPKPKGVLSVDNLMYQAVSRRRKPLEAIAFSETAKTPYSPPPLDGVEARAAGKQDVESLLRFIRDGGRAGPDAPLDLLVEACLEAGRLSPNSTNHQAWRFVVVRGEERLEGLRAACRAGRPWRAAIAGAAEAAGMDALLLDRPFWMIDLPIAFAQMSLAAASLDSPTVLCMDGLDEAAANRLLELPRKTRTGGVLGIP